MTKTFLRAWKSMGDQEFANPRNYLPVLPISLVGGIQVGQNTLDPLVALGYLLANAFGLGLCLAIAYLVWRIRKVSTTVLSPLVVIAFSLLIGIVKALSTGYLVFILEIEVNLSVAILGRMPGAITAALFTVLIISLLSSLQKQFKADRQYLIATRVSKDQAEFVMEKIESLEKLVGEIRLRLSTKTSEASTLLRDLLEQRVRPLSRELWDREERRLRSFEGRELARRALFSEPYPPFLLALILLIITPDAIGILTRLDCGTLSLLMQLALIVVTIYVLNLAKLIQLKTVLLVLSATLVVFSSATISFFIPEFILGEVPASSLYTFIFLLIFVPNMSIISSALVYFLRAGNEQIVALREEERALSEASTHQLEEMFLGRELAGALHGKVQNQILLSLSKIESGADLTHELNSVSDSISQVKESLKRTQNLTMSNLVSSWSAFIQIESDIEKVLSKTQARVIEEAISNAYRHGKASKVWVTISHGGKAIQVEDDGFGPMLGKKGLGSYIYSSAGKWQLKSRDEGGAVFSIELWS